MSWRVRLTEAYVTMQRHRAQPSHADGFDMLPSRPSISRPIAARIVASMRPWLPLPLLLAACTGGMQDPSTVEQQEGACVALEGRRFESVTDLECGHTPNGEALCKWRLQFSSQDDQSSAFQWSYSDVGESGQIECDGAAITSVTASPRQITGSFDAVSQKLVWEDNTYVLAN